MIVVKLTKPIRVGLKMTKTLEFGPPSALQIERLARRWNPKADGEALIAQFDFAIATMTGASLAGLKKMRADEYALAVDAVATVIENIADRFDALPPAQPSNEPAPLGRMN